VLAVVGEEADDTDVVRVVIADDNLLVREGLANLLRGQRGVRVVGVHGDPGGVLDGLDVEAPQVVVTDIRMPPTGTDEGIRLAGELRRSRPEVGVVVLSHYDDADYAIALLEEGSAGRAYLLKERVSDPAQIMSAIREVARGGSVVDPLVVEGLVTHRSRRTGSPIGRLTDREREVLSEMAEGRTNAAIAAHLSVSERAVEKHVNSLLAKLDLSEEVDVNRRVKAVLLYLAEQS
jgi:DNA-binding NarL/FixJ family response regulator